MAKKNQKESEFQTKLVDKIKDMFPGCYVLKNDGSNKPQGFPDWTIYFCDGRWAVLECKLEKNARKQPNQDYYVDRLNSMGYSRFVYPENEEEVLNDLQRTFGSGGETCTTFSE